MNEVELALRQLVYDHITMTIGAECEKEAIRGDAREV
ncbi:hypothetical protein Rleg2_4751 (plasmid) [Rhizobium leguminosarum bv. trifolii WSM2304]|uniref:Uncharacterized protein n=1 Tax=Rhizobium leguminosarum bv. trifolii (strain WSM2304) TaxID=395492 RepID=A0ABF7QUU5_RHILW|nr:hypothetical protein Rleg2_4751 [Rhizobium leguminosarum bv. trifolii WSM2304]